MVKIYANYQKVEVCEIRANFRQKNVFRDNHGQNIQVQYLGFGNFPLVLTKTEFW